MIYEGHRTIEAELKAAWLAPNATPYPGQLTPHDVNVTLRAARSASGVHWANEEFFSECPMIAIWASLAPLAKHYGADGKDVYTHIEEDLGLNLGETQERDRFKILYRRACRSIGINLVGNHPNQLFFPLLGVADAQMEPFATVLSQGFCGLIGFCGVVTFEGE